LYTEKASEQTVNLDTLHMIDDLEPGTIMALARRIEYSTTQEQLIYRESEIDELWRLLGLTNAKTPDEVHRLSALRDAVMEVHDMVGVDENTTGAATRLRAALS
jgi:hypothetical protein